MRATPLGRQSQAAPAAGTALPAVVRAHEDESARTVTSHSLTISGRGFSLGFTWRRVELDQPAVTGPDQGNVAKTGPTSSSAPPAKAAARRPRVRSAPSFAEVLRRQQLAGLVLMPSQPPEDRQPLLTNTTPAPPLPGQVCRAYDEALGPLAAPTSLCFTA